MSAKAKATDENGAVIIKKYANRRLYNTQSSSYITLDDLSRMTREGVDFKVIDAKSGDDITHVILTQIIMDEEAGGAQMLPLSFLRQIISLYGNSMQAMMPSYLEAATENFSANRKRWQEMMEKGMEANPFARMAENNMAMMRAATDAFMGRRSGEGARDGGDAGGENDGESAAARADLAQLREQMAAMQKRLDELDK